MNVTSASGMDSTSAAAFTIVNTLVSVCPITLHGIGIYLLCHISSMEATQKLYLIHMSLVEILFAFFQDVLVNVKTFVKMDIWFQYISFISHVIGFWWCDIMIMLTIDRLLRVYLNIKYELYVTTKTTKIIILGCYLASVTAMLPLIALQHITIQEKLYMVKIYVIPIFGGLLILAVILTYGYIYFKIKITRSHDRSQSQHSEGQQRQNKSIILPFWIIVTFIVFVMLPELVYIILVHKLDAVDDMLVYQINNLFWNVGLTADALLYIFLNGVVREKFSRMFGRSFSNIQSDSLATGSTTTARQTTVL